MDNEMEDGVLLYSAAHPKAGCFRRFIGFMGYFHRKRLSPESLEEIWIEIDSEEQ